MSRSAGGVYSLPAGNPVVSGTVINAAVHNATMTDIATALTKSIASDGVTTPTTDLPMGTKRHTGVGNANAQACYASVTDLQNGTLISLAAVAGTDTITANAPLNAVAAYVAGQGFQFVAAGANTGAVTINVSALGAKAITKYGATALKAGDIASGAAVKIVYDGTQFQMVGGFALNTQDWLTGANIASAATINLNAATGNRVHVTGTTTITAVTLTRGPRTLIFDDILTLTHHATNNFLPNAGGNITTGAGDVAVYESDGTVVRCVEYTRASGLPTNLAGSSIVLLAKLTPTVAANVDALTIFSSVYDNYLIVGDGILPGSTDVLRIRVANAGVVDATGGNYYTGTEAAAMSASDTALSLGSNTLTGGKGNNFVLHVLNANDATRSKAIIGRAMFHYDASPTYFVYSVNAIYLAAAAVSGVRFFWNGGANFSAVGSIRIYGLSNV
jgi:hypothetical protein